MKLNVFQKIQTIMYSMVVLVCVSFFIPYKIYNREVTYDSIWSDRYGIDLYRVAIFTFVLCGSYWFIFKYLQGKNALNEPELSKQSKKEAKAFLVFLGIPIAVIALCFLFNSICFWKESILENRIESLNEERKDYVNKREVHQEIYSSWLSRFEMRAYPDHEDWWSYLESATSYPNSMDVLFSELDRDYKKQHEINSPQQFSNFIILNSYNQEDKSINERVVPEIQMNEAKLDGIGFIRENKLILIVTYSVLSSFLLIYVLRPFISFFRTTLNSKTITNQNQTL